MYAKLFSRIAQSSLMEEKVTTRYVFMMMLALSDRHGEVIGTDVAIARMMNVPKNDFCESLKPLLEPDPDSNSPAEEGRRIIPSENGRGYKIVNYLNYRDIKSDDEKREYMREYMRQRRSKCKESEENVKPVNPCKDLLNDVTHTEAEADTEVKAEEHKKTEITPARKSTPPKAETPWPQSASERGGGMDAIMKRINSLRPEWRMPAQWNAAEMHMLHGGSAAQICELSDDDWQDLTAYMAAKNLPKDYWQPRSRLKFVETFSDVCGGLQRWRNKGNGNTKQDNPYF